MTFPISAGIYPRETDQSFVTPAVATSIGAIVVRAPKGTTGEAKLITSQKQFLDEYGTPVPSYESMYAALGFLEKGNQLQVVRVVGAGALASTTTINNAGAAAVFAVSAKNAGTWGDLISVSVSIAASTTAPFTITVFYDSVQVETWDVVMDSTTLDGFGNSYYLEDVINGNSAYITVTDSGNSNFPDATVTNQALASGADGAAPGDAEVTAGYDLFDSKESIEISLVINGGWATTSVQNNIITLCETRKDCIGILDIPSADTTVANMVTYVGTTLNANTSYAAIYGGRIKIYDQYNDKQVTVAPSGHVAGVMAETANVAEIWYAPAGLRRGTINALSVTPVFTEGERDTLYNAKINPIQSFTGEGIVVWGQKTLQTQASALDRVNVRMLMITIQKALGRALRPYVFEFNDSFTRSNIKSLVDNYMEDIKVRRGVTDFITVCDTSNNTAQVIDTNQLVVDLYVKPTRTAEFIRLNTIISSTGAAFTVSG